MIPGGFFTKEQTGAGATIQRLTGCGACGLAKECKSPKIQAAGRGEKKILIISEIPCAEEDSAGRLFQGEASKWLKKKLEDYGINVERDCRKINAVNCRTPKGRAPTSNEIAMCRPTVWKEVESFEPELIILFGSAAIESFIGDRWKKDLGGINKWRGWNIPDRKVKAWVCPMFHPSYVLKATDQRKGKLFNPVVEVIFDQDLRRALKHMEKQVPVFRDEQDMVQVVKDPKALAAELDGLLEWWEPISIDFETTGLKPQAPGHRIVTCSISTSDKHALAFPMPMRGPAAVKLRRLLKDPRILKRAHNAKFEDNWSLIRFGALIDGWEWDSMLAAHMLDNRAGITSLKFQAYVHFGLIDYDSHIADYLKTDSGNANDLNRIDEAPIDDILVYNGVDTILEYRLSDLQMPLIQKGLYR